MSAAFALRATADKACAMALLMATVLALSCGDPPTGPSGNAPRVTSINPTTGSTAGGTTVTIAGANFAPGAIVTIGGTPASSVNVLSESSITAVTGARSPGAADVAVSVSGRTGSLPGGFTYVAGQPPVVQSLTARGSRANQPERFADLGEEINVSATVTDPDTPTSSLTYGWAASSGTFGGSGPAVRWRAPSSGFTTPGTVTLNLSVSDGASTVTSSVVIRVHDSSREVGDMAKLFLEDFSRQTLSPEEIVRNFRDGCGLGGTGKQNELLDVRNNQRTHRINAWAVGNPAVTVNFGGVCPFRSRLGDACAAVTVDWTSTCINETRLDGTKVCDLGDTDRVRGIDHVTASYIDNRWWLCDSDFEGTVLSLTTGKIRPSWTFKR